jgi:hypothetical protein
MTHRKGFQCAEFSVCSACISLMLTHDNEEGIIITIILILQMREVMNREVK